MEDEFDEEEAEEGCSAAGGAALVDESEELWTGFGCRWNGNRIFRNAVSPWTGTLCWAWSRK